ncbi:MAG: hypothetical protein HY735_15135 [Verrucomicrobia bacterium]|nr:hypothetical protein [Verrucomicrobiota bacterium]
MVERTPALNSNLADSPAPVSFTDAAGYLGLDIFTFYSLVQRDEIPTFLAPWGEFVVSQHDLDQLIARKE